jgi:hypothetical protein
LIDLIAKTGDHDTFQQSSMPTISDPSSTEGDAMIVDYVKPSNEVEVGKTSGKSTLEVQQEQEQQQQQQQEQERQEQPEGSHRNSPPSTPMVDNIVYKDKGQILESILVNWLTPKLQRLMILYRKAIGL